MPPLRIGYGDIYFQAVVDAIQPFSGMGAKGLTLALNPAPETRMHPSSRPLASGL